jgi:RNA polymerase sigma-70 factor (ECF subfamily)
VLTGVGRSAAVTVSVDSKPGVPDAGVSLMTDSDTLSLLMRARAGDTSALDQVVAHYRPLLSRWARGRLPLWARNLADTDDLVQNTLIKALRNLGRFEPTSAVAFQQYLREAVKNAIRDQIRGAKRRPGIEELGSDCVSNEPTPLERLLGADRLARYEDALGRLSEEERSAVVARFEFGFTHCELAAALGKGTPDAARKLVKKAMGRLLLLMQRSAPTGPADTSDSAFTPPRRSSD